MYLMNIVRIIWLPQIVDKLDWKHNVMHYEVEQLFTNKPQFRFLEKGRVDGQNVYAALGRTDDGRYLIAIFIRKPESAALVISARDMDKKERKLYGKS